ncbi:MAG: glycosyltransferase [Thermonemataceae bacterium]|nr:glycosyltransferase [Thermonemataceae bacterium]
MIEKTQYQALYTAFDVFPSAKGAATHIYHFSKSILKAYPQGMLYVLGDDKLPVYDTWEENIHIWRFKSTENNFLEKTEAYSQQLMLWLKEQKKLKVCHFRDIWGGIPILLHPHKNYQSIFEVNALPSIELPYRYEISQTLLTKIRELEQFCLEKADLLIVPSEVIRQHLLVQRNISSEKIKLIQNGAELPKNQNRPLEAPQQYAIYFGALQEWQGVDTLFRAFRLLQDTDLHLVICSSHKYRFTKPYHKFAEKLGISEKIIWKYQLSKEELYAWVEHALFSFAPLKECSRNLEQGCSPLKILESMAVATPVIASDMPVTREIINNEYVGKLIRADRPAEWARAVRIWLSYPDNVKKIGKNAQEHIKKHFSWESKTSELLKEIHYLVYQAEKN